MSWLLALDAGSCVFHRAHGLDDYLVWVGGPEAMALVKMVSRSLTSSMSLFGSYLSLTRCIITHCATTASRLLRRGGGATAVVAVAVAIEEGYQCEWDALTLCLHLA